MLTWPLYEPYPRLFRTYMPYEAGHATLIKSSLPGLPRPSVPRAEPEKL